MSIAWTTLLVIALLLPGVFFLIGTSYRERFTKEIVRTSGMGEVGFALLIALGLHFASWLLLWSVLGFRPETYLWPVTFKSETATYGMVKSYLDILFWGAAYIIVISLLSFLLGWGCSTTGLFVKHKWIVKFGPRRSLGAITAYILTKTSGKDKVLMYEGQLQEYYMTSDGQFSYLVLSNCARFFLDLTKEPPDTTEHLDLFKDGSRAEHRLWNYLMIDGSSIANVLFERVPEVLPDKGLEKEIDEAIAEARLPSEPLAVAPAAA